MNYRCLSVEDIVALESQGCQCDDWTRVSVAEPFVVQRYRNVRFSGEIKLGSASGEYVLPDGFAGKCGIYNAALQDCTVGKNVYINNVAQYIYNYEIADGAIIENVGVISCKKDATFGRDVEVNVLNETGGREVMLCEKLSAQVAYLMAMYRHDAVFTDQLKKLVADYNGTCRSGEGYIGNCARIAGVYKIQDVIVGDYAVVSGAKCLEDGTIVSSEISPVTVDVNVIAKHFMAVEGAHLGCGALINHGFIGQNVEISNQFTAHDSLFFANTIVENGESAAAFAGPFTVSMHKSSLLIAGMYSFMNAGSGTNQSNHKYKLGPIHQGVLERGSKTASDSYVLLPARVGAFSLVQGRHSKHPDTARLPFSYLIESNGRYSLVPGVSLKSAGTIRDAQKWRKRDKRKMPNKLDNITFDMLSPYTLERVFDGIDLLHEMELRNEELFGGYTITPTARQKGLKYYRLAADKFMGRAIVDKILSVENFDEFTASASGNEDSGRWIDACGQLMPQTAINKIVEDVKNTDIATLDQLLSSLAAQSERYQENVWNWVCSRMERWYGKPCNALTIADLVDIAVRWRDAVWVLDELVREDARKEFSAESRISFGIDGDENIAVEDFKNSRGEYEENSFVKMVIEHENYTAQKMTKVEEKIKNWC
jgi:hypothetical protein